MSLTEHQHSIINLLRQEITITSNLLEALQQEQNALLGNSAPVIERALANKQQPIADLEKTSRQREDHLHKNRYPANPVGMLAYIHDHDPHNHHQLDALWQQLKILGTQCLQQNQLNGSIITTKRLSTQIALNILRGSKPEHLACYTPTGQAPAKLDSHSLGQA